MFGKWSWPTQPDVSPRPKDEILDSLSQCLNALGSRDVQHVILVSLHYDHHFHPAVLIWNVYTMECSSRDCEASAYFPSTNIGNAIAYD
jgi:hypothetical protein